MYNIYMYVFYMYTNALVNIRNGLSYSLHIGLVCFFQRHVYIVSIAPASRPDIGLRRRIPLDTYLRGAIGRRRYGESRIG